MHYPQTSSPRNFLHETEEEDLWCWWHAALTHPLPTYIYACLKWPATGLAKTQTLWSSVDVTFPVPSNILSANLVSFLDLSPVGDAYVKKGLAPAEDRVNMCRVAVEYQPETTRFVMVDNFEALQRAYTPTAKVLDHINYEINEKLGGIDDGTGNKVKAQVALLAGADLVETFLQPGVWSDKDLDHILCDCEYKRF
jgi:hypothetical protein